jgi:hypothetical protein
MGRFLTQTNVTIKVVCDSHESARVREIFSDVNVYFGDEMVGIKFVEKSEYVVVHSTNVGADLIVGWTYHVGVHSPVMSSHIQSNESTVISPVVLLYEPIVGNGSSPELRIEGSLPFQYYNSSHFRLTLLQENNLPLLSSGGQTLCIGNVLLVWIAK